ncbi:hypothetical protein HK102_013443 [Quaeritorhiza haematococci]|nr:hypothetical protein HK102_013443 [Quaeritorhiza haematococci]
MLARTLRVSLLMLLWGSVSAQSFCSTRHPTPTDVRRELKRRALSPRQAAAANFPVTIDVHFHVISKAPTGVENGNIPDALIEDQIRVLNDNFQQTNSFNFRLAGIDRTENATWFEVVQRRPMEAEMKAASRKGGRKDLNIWSAGLEPGVFGQGFATFPEEFDANPNLDGVVIKHESIPGVASGPYSQGLILVHEVGHWLGLHHTFLGGCSYPNDFVDDTPATEGTGFAIGCPTELRTCDRASFTTTADILKFVELDRNVTADPVRNFMHDTDNSCMREFTPGQTQRMRTMWVQEREKA